MGHLFLYITACGVALVASLWGTNWVRQRGIMDIPNERSSHTRPTPRGGGLGIVAGVALAMVILLLTGEVPLLATWGMAAAFGIAALGWLDDHRDLSSGLRLLLQAVGAVMLVLGAAIAGRFYLLPPSLFSLPFGASALIMFLFVVGATNAYNFMDGIDGLAATQAVIMAGGWVVLFWFAGELALAALAGAVGAASLGFLHWNFPPARIFMGDVGSTFLGFSFAVLPLLATASLPSDRLILVGGIFLSPVLFDTALTIVRRAMAGENILTAHRSHLYQRLVIRGYSHLAVTSLYGGLAVMSVLAGFALYLAGSPVVIGLVLLLLLGMYAALFGFVTAVTRNAPR